jgi:hypothetical protein
MSCAVIRSLLVVLCVAVLASGCSGGEGGGTTTTHGVGSEVVVPNLIGLRSDRATLRLCRLGLVGNVTVVARTGQIRRPQQALAASRVRAMEPRPGVRVLIGTGIEVRVSMPRNAAVSFRAGC